MRSRGVGAFRPVARAGVIASSIALLAMVLLPSAAFAATFSLGATAGPGAWTCAAGFNLVQISSGAPGYSAPADGTITAWSTMADATMVGPVGLQVWRLVPGQPDPTYTFVGASPLATLTPSTVNKFTLDKPIPVLQGDVLGLRIEGVALCAEVGAGSYGYMLGANPAAVGTAVVFGSASGTVIDVQATLETGTPPPPPPPPPSSGCDYHGQSNGNDNCQN